MTTKYIAASEIACDVYQQTINPQRLMPALAFGNQIVVQANAILAYLGETFPPAL